MIKIAAYIDKTPRAQSVWETIKTQIQQTSIEKADIIITIGGDGFMLETLHKSLDYQIPTYGINCGSVGFLMNGYDKNDALYEKIHAAQKISLYSLKIEAFDGKNQKIGDFIAINEISIFRTSAQSAHLTISVDGKIQIPKLICDGVLVATPAGSTAYNSSVYGPIIPVGTNLLALTPISPFYPKRWRGALLPDNAIIKIESCGQNKRPISAAADNCDIPNINQLIIHCDKKNPLHILFDPDHNLQDRILREQFIP